MKFTFEKRFTFEKHPSKKGHCPKCKHKGTFRYYVGLPREYGKCERINECGYFANPSEEPKEVKDDLLGIVKELPKPKEPTIIFPEKGTISSIKKNLESQFHYNLGAMCDSPFNIPNEFFTKWGVGANNKGTCFILADKKKVYNVKTMFYEAMTCKRDKSRHIFYLKAPEGSKYSRCLYGLHLLEKGKPICLVESEKTAFLAAFYYPQFNWLATSGAGGLTSETITPLFNNEIYYLCDADKAGRDNSTIRKLNEYKQNWHLIDLFPDRTDGYDLADYILEEYLINQTLPEIKPPKKEKKDENIEQIITEDEPYLLPKEVEEPLKELLPMIKKYSLFMSNCKVYVMNKPEKGIKTRTFKQITNFEIEIIQHMQDEKFPKKLVRIKNVYGREVIFDVLSTEINSPAGFENMVTNHGKYYFIGSKYDHTLLKIYLFEKMGSGRMIEVLGWQPEGFWVWNNQVVIPGTTTEELKTIDIDDNGVFKHKNVSYYVPSANKVYANVQYKYQSQKKFYFRNSELSFHAYASQLIRVHREHAMIALLFSISSVFQDFVVKKLNFFPMMFMYGSASSGKTQLIHACQSFFGDPPTAINLEGGVSTMKAHIREFAQFSNTISHLSEYKNIDPKLDGILKGIWDRDGYKRGNIDSHVGTDSIPILSSAVVSGNYAPDQDALITRLIWCFMDKTVFSENEDQEYEILEQMLNHGVSAFTNLFLKYRKEVEKTFSQKQKEFKAVLKERNKDANSRMIANLSVLGAFYQIFCTKIMFPFSQIELIDHFSKTIERQMNRLNNANIVTKFWECYLSSMRIGQVSDQIRARRDFKIEGDILFFNFTNCFNRIQRQWYQNYKDVAPSKTAMSSELQKHDGFIGIEKVVSMSPGRDGVRTSAIMFDLSKLDIKEEIIANMQFQLHEYKEYGNFA